MVAKAKRGEMEKTKVDECYYAWRNHASKGNSYLLLQRMDKYYKELWKGGGKDVLQKKNPADQTGKRDGASQSNSRKAERNH